MESIWQIIPKITSPLAVLSFIVYVFYLFKQSSDRKKEKTLAVNDSTAQQQAVNLILKDYPDLQIDPISDPVGALELAKTIVGDRLKKHHKTLNFFLSLAILFAATYLISLVILNGHSFWNPISATSKTWAEVKSIENGKEYPILAVVCHIMIKDEMKPDSSRVRKACFRYHYTLKALKDITLKDPVFLEQFISSNQKNVHPWAGSEIQEIESINDGSYWIKFNAKKDDIFTVTSGADYFYSIPLTDVGATGCFKDLKLQENEWLTCYNNTSDYIDNVTIIVEGDNVDIDLPPNSAYRKSGSNEPAGDGRCRAYINDNQCTLVAKWEKLSKGECVGFKIRWSIP